MARPVWTTLMIGLAVGALAVVGGAPRQAAPAATREAAYRANNIGVAYLEQYNHQAAAENFRKALDVDPSLAMAKVNLAIALFYVPELDAARKQAEAVIAGDPKVAQAHYILGLVAKSDNRVDDAVAAFRQVLSIDAADLGARVNLAQLLMQRREYQEAVDLLRPAVEAEPYHVTAKYNLGVALTRAGKAEEGAKVMAEFQALREGGYGTTFSNNYLEQGRYAEAVASTGAEAGLVEQQAPDVTFVAAAKLPAAHASALGAPAIAGGVTLADIDRDGDLDLLDVAAGRLRVYTNDKGALTDATEKLGIPAPDDAGAVVAVIAGDYDNDERKDLFVVGLQRHRLLRQIEGGRFEDVTAAAQIAAPAALFRAAAFVDVDHDGDLDLFLVGSAGLAADAATPAPAAPVLLRNNGNGTFADISRESGVAATPVRGVAIVPTDFDNRRDVDLVVLADGRAPGVLKNMRDGTFRDVAADVGLGESGRFSGAAAGDVNKDGFTDFVFVRADAPPVLELSDGRGRFTTSTPFPSAAGASAATLIDYDNDGLLDLVALGASGPRLWRNAGASWQDLGGRVFTGMPPCPSCVSGGSLAAGDLDRDGDTDLVIKTWDAARGTGHLSVQKNEGGSRHASLAVRLAGRVSNRSAIGAKVELRAGSLRSRIETASATPAVAPADIVFGLGSRPAAEVVRVLWPAGILQAEIPDPAGRGAQPLDRTLSLTELDRKPSSCPYLFTWNGERFEFITDFMGGGEMGYVHGPGHVNVPDPEEYTRIPAGALRERDGRYELRVTNELEEALYIDRLALVAVDHPSNVEVHPREGLVSPPFPPFELYEVASPRPILKAVDHAGRDVTERVRAIDRRFVGDLPLERVRGYAKPHTLTITLPSPVVSGLGRGSSGAAKGGALRQDPAGEPLLLLTGWTDYAFSSDNIAAGQAGLTLAPPSLQARTPSGEWVTVIDEIGVPVGRPQTIVVSLKDKVPPGTTEVRIATSMRVYWDQVHVGTRRPGTPRVTRVDAARADLRWRGFSAEVSPDGREPFGYDYGRVSSQSPWKVIPGRYTREGDVHELLREADDFFVISRPGDELALSFDAAALPPVAAGWTRTFLLHSIGYSKEMDRNSASPDETLPLPFRTMTRYPYPASERYPDSPAHRAYHERWNTRVVGRAVPPIELSTP